MQDAILSSNAVRLNSQYYFSTLTNTRTHSLDAIKKENSKTEITF